MATIDKLQMIHMAVTDMDKMKNFYTDKLGFTASQDVGGGDQHWVTLEFPGGGPTIVLTTFASNLKPGTMAMYFAAADVEAVYQELKAKGVTLDGEVQKDDWGQRFNLTDPESNQVIISKG